MQYRTLLAATLAFATTACADRTITNPDLATSDLAPAFSLGAARPGTVYALTNGTSNAVLVFPRLADGTLGPATAFATGGAGTGSGLGSQGALILAQGGRWLLAVNAGSDEISVFRVRDRGVQLVSRVSSGGDQPISVTAHENLVYVVNAGGSGNIAGFRLMPNGQLVPIAGSSQPLSGAGTGPAQIEFAPNGRTLVVTEKATNRILTYQVGPAGASGPTIHASAGATPFGFAFARRDVLVVSEAFGGAADASATSSYRLTKAGLITISASVPTTETAACWTVVTKNGRYAYVTNTGSGTITGYAIGPGGALTILDADGVTGMTGPGSSPLDAAFSVNSRFLYTLNGNGTISAFEVAADGGLAPIAGASGLPSGATGLAAH
jgi:6-phosphogluconolactonase (cycloisomerase 2 family)